MQSSSAIMACDKKFLLPMQEVRLVVNDFETTLNRSKKLNLSLLPVVMTIESGQIFKNLHENFLILLRYLDIELGLQI